jgi:hypothetical protein
MIMMFGTATPKLSGAFFEPSLHRRGGPGFGIAAARAHATIQIRDMRASVPAGRLQDWSGWTMTVVDAKGKTLLEIGFDLNPRPLN